MDVIINWILIILCASFFIICDSLAAYWANEAKPAIMSILISLSPIGYLIFAQINKQKSLSVNSGIVNSIIVIGTITVGIFYFEDELTIRQLIGLLLATSAVIVVS